MCIRDRRAIDERLASLESSYNNFVILENVLRVAYLFKEAELRAANAQLKLSQAPENGDVSGLREELRLAKLEVEKTGDNLLALLMDERDAAGRSIARVLAISRGLDDVGTVRFRVESPFEFRVPNDFLPEAVSYTHLTLPTIYSV